MTNLLLTYHRLGNKGYTFFVLKISDVEPFQSYRLEGDS